MLQIRKIREFMPRGSKVAKKYDSPLKPDLTVTNIQELFSKLPDIIDNIPEEERYNVFYTLGHMPDTVENDPKHRKWSWQEVIPFDIDDIEVDGDSVDPKYMEAIGEALSVDLKKCVTMFSGNGLQILIRPKFQITDAKWFKHNEKYYQTLVSKVNDKLFEYGLKGEADASAFAPNRLFRLPLTFNKKPGKPERKARLLTDCTEPIEYSMKLASGLPDVEENEQISEKQLSYFSVDTESVLEGCNFLKDMKSHPQNVSEPEWYAGLSILSRLDDGEKLSHEYSKGHGSYSERDTSRKIRQSLEASGPRTCDNIHKMWGKCRECPNYKKVPSPISIKGANFIATSDTGFHIMPKKGGALVPQYEDLRRFYDQEGHYLNIGDIHYRWQGTHYKLFKDRWIDGYAQGHFNPVADNKKAVEFRGLVKRTNLEDDNFFQDTTHRHINLSNGILNIDTTNLEPHNEDFGFKHCLDFNYDPIATAPTFKKHLEDITQNDKTLEQNLLEYMGYCLANDLPFAQKMLVLTGSGQNGKSTFLRVLRAIGGSGVKSLGPRELVNGFYRQQLDGSLINIIEEMPAFVDKTFWEDMKALITGAPVTASMKNKDPYTFECKTKFIMTCNELPKGANPNHGYFRRLLIVPFNAKFQGQKDDKFIADRIIQDEMPGVLNMVLEAYHNLRNGGFNFTKAKAVDLALSQYQTAVDNVRGWAVEHIEFGDPDPSQRGIISDSTGTTCLDVNEAYKHYRVWVEEEGERPVSREHFSRRLGHYLVETGLPSMKKLSGSSPVKRVSVAGKRSRVIYGVTWCSDDEF